MTFSNAVLKRAWCAGQLAHNKEHLRIAGIKRWPADWLAPEELWRRHPRQSLAGVRAVAEALIAEMRQRPALARKLVAKKGGAK